MPPLTRTVVHSGLRVLHPTHSGLRVLNPKLFKPAQAITAIASVADCVEENFAAYYGRIMPTLKQMLTQVPNPDPPNPDPYKHM